QPRAEGDRARARGPGHRGLPALAADRAARNGADAFRSQRVRHGRDASHRRQDRPVGPRPRAHCRDGDPGGRCISARGRVLCRLLGYLVGDGTYRTWGSVGFISSDPETFGDVVDIVTRNFDGVTPRLKRHAEGYREADFRRLYENGYGRPYGNPLREWLRGL